MFDAIRRDLRPILSDDARLFATARRAALVLVPVLLALLVAMQWPSEDPRFDRLGKTMGHDFSQVWVAGRSALAGRGAEAYDVAAHETNQIAVFGPDAALFAWHYPPSYLLFAAGLALLPYLGAVLAFGLASASLFVAAMAQALQRWDAVLVSLAHPLFLRTLSYGQNGLLTASLLTLGLMSVDRRPVLAGISLGLTAYKPQLALLAPLALLATGRWRSLLAAGATVLAVAALSFAVLGAEPWLAFLNSIGATNDIILNKARAGLAVNMSAFGAVRLLGGPAALAWAAQIGAALAAVGLVLRVWLTCDDARLRAASVLVTTPLTSPYVPDYDLAVLIPGTGLFVLAATGRGGLLPRERAFLVLSFFAALAPRTVAEATGVPLGFALALATFAVVAARALRGEPGLTPARA